MPPLTAQHIAPATGGFEPQRAYDFTIEIYGLAGGEVLQLALHDAFFPAGNNDQIPIQYFAEERKVAGHIKFADGQLKFVDYVDENVLGILYEWRKLVHDLETGAQGFASDYKKQASVVLLAPDGSRARVIRMEGVWPSEVNADGLAYSDNDVLKVNINLVFDTAIPLF